MSDRRAGLVKPQLESGVTDLRRGVASFQPQTVFIKLPEGMVFPAPRGPFADFTVLFLSIHLLPSHSRETGGLEPFV